METSQDAIFRLSVEGTNYLVTAKPRPDNSEAHFETYCSSVLGQIDITNDHIQAIVIVPTSVIAEELSIVCQQLAKQLKINLVVSTGKTEGGELHPKGQIIIGTCTHIYSLTNDGIISASKCRFMVLDAVVDLFLPSSDGMIEAILKQATNNLNIFLFSATFPISVKELMKLPRIANVTRNECIKCKDTKDFTVKLLREKFDIEVKLKEYQEKSDSKINEYELRLQNLESTVENQDATIKNQDARIKNQDAGIKNQEARVKNQEARIKNQDATLKNQDATIKNQDSRIKELEFNVEMLVKVTENLQKNLRDCLREIKKLTRTTSTGQF